MKKLSKKIGLSVFLGLAGTVDGIFNSFFNPLVPIKIGRDIKKQGIKEMVRKSKEKMEESGDDKWPVISYAVTLLSAYTVSLSSHIYNFYQNPDELYSQIPIATNLIGAAAIESYHLYKKHRDIKNNKERGLASLV